MLRKAELPPVPNPPLAYRDPEFIESEGRKAESGSSRSTSSRSRPSARHRVHDTVVFLRLRPAQRDGPMGRYYDGVVDPMAAEGLRAAGGTPRRIRIGLPSSLSINSGSR